MGKINKKSPKKTQKTLLDVKADTKSTSVKSGRVNKQNKRDGRRKGLLEKIVVAQREKKEAIEKQKRDRTHIVGDLRPLMDALPSLDELLKLKQNKDAIRTGIPSVDRKMGTKTQSKYKAKPQKIMDRQKDNTQRISFFKQLVNRSVKSSETTREIVSRHLRSMRLEANNRE